MNTPIGTAELHTSCDGSCQSRMVKEVGTLSVEICADPKCARVYTVCVCPSEQNTWNADGTVLTCSFCGRDCT